MSTYTGYLYLEDSVWIGTAAVLEIQADETAPENLRIMF